MPKYEDTDIPYKIEGLALLLLIRWQCLMSVSTELSQLCEWEWWRKSRATILFIGTMQNKIHVHYTTLGVSAKEHAHVCCIYLSDFWSNLLLLKCAIWQELIVLGCFPNWWWMAIVHVCRDAIHIRCPTTSYHMSSHSFLQADTSLQRNGRLPSQTWNASSRIMLICLIIRVILVYFLTKWT